MLRLTIVFIFVLTLASAAAQTAAQEEACPAGDMALLATPGAETMASPEGSPAVSPTAEPYGSPAASPTGSPTTAMTCVVEIPAFRFMPPVIKIPVGTSVIWSNTHGRAHTATADDFSWDTGQIAPGDSSDPIVFDVAGTFPYHCDNHTEMRGTVEVE
jgi:plastocyanin